MTASRRVLIIAGANGAGKTTFATEFLPNEADCPTFINADLIAAGLNPFRPQLAGLRAGRLMLGMIEEHVRKGEGFALETTLSGQCYARLLPLWRERGYRAKLFFLRLQGPEIAVARVRHRVAGGGHAVPEPVVRRRFQAGLRNLQHVYKGLVDEWAVYDTSRGEPKLAGDGEDIPTGVKRRGGPRAVQSTDPDFTGAWAALRRAAAKARRRGFDTIGSVPIVVDGKVVWQREDGTLLDKPGQAP